MEVSLSIEETNALRRKLGLRELDEGNTKEKKEEISTISQQKESLEKAEIEAKQRKRQQVQQAITEQRKKLKGKSLGEGDENLLDFIGRIRPVDGLETRPKVSEGQSHAGQDTPGNNRTENTSLNVLHSLDDIADREETILVLNDASVMDEDDHLVNYQLLQKEKSQKTIQRYNPYDAEDEFGVKKNILSQYDELDQQSFKLSIGKTMDLQKMQEKKKTPNHIPKGTVSLDYEKGKEISDYYTQEEIVSFRKPKKKKKNKNGRRKLDEPDLAEDTEMLDVSVKNAHSNILHAKEIASVNFVDDDDLQQALAVTRQKVVRNRDPAEIARIALEQADESDGQDAGLVISEATEFVQKLKVEEKDKATPTQVAVESDSDEDVRMELEEMAAKDAAMEDNESKEQPDMDTQQDKHDIIEAEPLVSSGLAATLNLLKRDGLVGKKTPEQLEQERIKMQRLKWIAEQKQREKQAELEQMEQKKQGRSNRMTKEEQWELERQKKEQERKAIQQTQEKFKDYVPDVKLEYLDEFGRKLTPKEVDCLTQAFKELAHRFHGNTSGKRKQEKKLLRIAESVMQMKASASDASLGAAETLIEQTKQQGKAYIPLKPDAITPLSSATAHSIDEKKPAKVEKPKSSTAPMLVPVSVQQKKEARTSAISQPIPSTQIPNQTPAPATATPSDQHLAAPVSRPKIAFNLKKRK